MHSLLTLFQDVAQTKVKVFEICLWPMQTGAFHCSPYMCPTHLPFTGSYLGKSHASFALDPHKRIRKCHDDLRRHPRPGSIQSALMPWGQWSPLLLLKPGPLMRILHFRSPERSSIQNDPLRAYAHMPLGNAITSLNSSTGDFHQWGGKLAVPFLHQLPPRHTTEVREDAIRLSPPPQRWPRGRLRAKRLPMRLKG